MKLSRRELRVLIESVINEEDNSSKVIVKGASGLEYCASEVKKAVLSKDSNKKEISLGELNEMFDFYLTESFGLITVVVKGHDPGMAQAKKFELSGEKYDHDRLNYHPFGMTVPPKVVK